MREKINEIIRGCLSNPDIEINEEVLLGTSEVINSFEFIQAVAGIEEAFQIEISDEALESFRTIGDLYEYVEAHVK